MIIVPADHRNGGRIERALVLGNLVISVVQGDIKGCSKASLLDVHHLLTDRQAFEREAPVLVRGVLGAPVLRTVAVIVDLDPGIGSDDPVAA